MIRMIVTEDTLRVIALRCGETQGRTRDDLIALQTANTIKHFLLSDSTPKPMRWADEPRPVVEKDVLGRNGGGA